MASPVDSARPTSATTTAGTNHTINVGSPAAGSLLVVGIRFAVAPGTVTFTGFTQLASDTSDASDDQTMVFYRWCDGSEGASEALSTQNSTKMSAICWVVTGAINPSTQAPQISTVAVGTTTANTCNPGSVSGTGGSKAYLFLAFGGLDGEPATYFTGAPTNYTNITSANSGTAGQPATNCAVGGASRQLTAASDDPGAFTHGAAATGWTAWTIVVHPGPVLGASALAVTVSRSTAGKVTARGASARSISVAFTTDGSVPGADSRWTNNAEGGSNGVSPTTTDTGSGDHWSGLSTTGTGVTNVYSTDHPAHGSLGYKLALASGSTAGTYLQWFDTTAPASSYGRAYLYFTGTQFFGGLTRLISLGPEAGGDICIIAITGGATPHWSIWNQSESTSLWASSASPAYNTLYRIEWHIITNNTTTSQIQVRIYAGDDTSPIEDSGVVNVTTSVAAADAHMALFGIPYGGGYWPSSDGTAYYDDLVAFASNWVGPVSTGPTTWYGTVSQSLSVTSAASGKRTAFGESDSVLTTTISAKGVRQALGKSTASYTISTSSAGKRIALGSSPLVLSISRGTTAKVGMKAGVSLALVVARSSTGRVGIKASTTSSLVVTFVSAGSSSAGHQDITGSSSFTITVSRASAGTRKTFGTTTPSETVTFSTTGTRKTFGIVSRTETVAFSSSGKLTAKAGVARGIAVAFVTPSIRKTFGASTWPLTLNVGSTGAKKTFGSASVVETVAFTGVGRRTAFGVVARSETVSFSTLGKVTAKSSVAVPISVARTTVGKITAKGVATVALTVTFTSSGGGIGQKYGSVGMVLTVSRATAGLRKTFGASSLAETVAFSTPGIRKTFGISARTETITFSTAGKRTAFGVVSRSENVAFSVVGKRTTFGAVPWVETVTFSSVGKIRAKGASSLNLAVTFYTASSGTQTRYGNVAVVITVSRSATGVRTVTGSAARSVTVTFASAGKRTALGAVARPITVTISGSGTRKTFSSISIPLSIVFSSTGKRKTFAVSTLPIVVTYRSAGIQWQGALGFSLPFAMPTPVMVGVEASPDAQELSVPQPHPLQFAEPNP